VLYVATVDYESPRWIEIHASHIDGNAADWAAQVKGAREGEHLG
jgi:hypothetical protein